MLILKTRIKKNPPSQSEIISFGKRIMKEMRMHGDICLLITTDKTIRKLNCNFAKRDKATDVLSFPNEMKKIYGNYIGDIAISLDKAKKQSIKEGHSLMHEIKILLLHGIIHLKGFDHASDNGQMDLLENKMQKKLGLEP